MSTTRLVVIGDIHAGVNRSSLPGSSVYHILSEWVSFINQVIKPDVIIDLGDRLNPVDGNSDSEVLREIGNILGNADCPVYFILGNHDLDNLSQREHEEAIGYNLGNRSVQVKDFRLLLVNAQDPVVQGIGGSVSEKTLDWIRNELRNESRRAVLFTHQATNEEKLERNLHFRGIEEFAYVSNRKELLDICEESGDVVAAINGHVHWPSIFVEESILHVSVPSFTDTWNELPNVPGSFTVIDLCEDEISVENYMFKPSILMGRFTICSKRRGKK